MNKKKANEFIYSSQLNSENYGVFFVSLVSAIPWYNISDYALYRYIFKKAYTILIVALFFDLFGFIQLLRISSIDLEFVYWKIFSKTKVTF